MRLIRHVLLTLFLLGSAGVLMTSTAEASSTNFVRAACPFALGQGMVEGKTVYCGYLVVPENRARPNGRTIKLAVAVFKSPSASPAPAPLIFLQGGPGGAIVEDLGSSITSQNAPALVGNQDLILVDQRGNGLSFPFLGCNALRDFIVSVLDQQTSPPQAEESYLRAAQRCYNTFVRAGIDLNRYTTIDNAADIAELGPALGYHEVNVYGVSYGTRVALTMMRSFPANIRSVIIDAVLPTQANMFTQVPVSMSRVFNVLFAGCAADRACNTAYPHLDRTFYDLVDRLNAAPVTIQVKNPETGQTANVLLTGDRVVNVVFQMLYVTAYIPYLPQLIYATAEKYYSYIASQFDETLNDVVPYGSGISEGTYYSVECGEDAPFTNEREIMNGISKMPPALQSNAQTSQISSYRTCTQAWPVNTVPLGQKLAVRSRIPTLVLNGEYDPITPPDLGELAARTLGRANSYTFPGIGHGAYLSAACPHSIAVAFLANPSAVPDSSCIAKMSPPRWVVEQPVPSGVVPPQVTGAAAAVPLDTTTPAPQATATPAPQATATPLPQMPHTGAGGMAHAANTRSNLLPLLAALLLLPGLIVLVARKRRPLRDGR
jgi:pimeloyl-ACP methyl ester carboxylesterase